MAEEKQEQREFTFNLRICVMMFVVFIIFSILCLQLWNTQVLNWRNYEDKAQKQSVRRIRIPPVRGKIFTADGKALATNRTSWDVHFHLSEMRQKNRRETIAYILALYGMNVIDSGVAVMNMHAPWEATSKADVYEAYRGYLAFIEEATI